MTTNEGIKQGTARGQSQGTLQDLERRRDTTEDESLSGHSLFHWNDDTSMAWIVPANLASNPKQTSRGIAKQLLIKKKKSVKTLPKLIRSRLPKVAPSVLTLTQLEERGHQMNLYWN